MSDTKAAPAKAPVVADGDKFPLTHKGFGRYEMNGTLYASKDEALAAQAKLLAQETAADLYGDVLPEGVDITVTDRSLVFRGSILEVPMNEVFLPDGDYNPMYDRAWYYAWAARRARSISAYEALGYKKFTYQELEAMVEEGKAPAHYLSLLQRDGDYLVHGDLLLMRTPRVYWRQRKAAQQAATEARVATSRQMAEASSDALGLPRASVGPF